MTIFILSPDHLVNPPNNWCWCQVSALNNECETETTPSVAKRNYNSSSADRKTKPFTTCRFAARCMFVVWDRQWNGTKQFTNVIAIVDWCWWKYLFKNSFRTPRCCNSLAVLVSPHNLY